MSSSQACFVHEPTPPIGADGGTIAERAGVPV
jgi:hypothetical protein